jgi:hypothetical protein
MNVTALGECAPGQERHAVGGGKFLRQRRAQAVGDRDVRRRKLAGGDAIVGDVEPGSEAEPLAFGSGVLELEVVGVADVVVRADLRLEILPRVPAIGGVEDVCAIAADVVRESQPRYEARAVDADDAAGRFTLGRFDADADVGRQAVVDRPVILHEHRVRVDVEGGTAAGDPVLDS